MLLSSVQVHPVCEKVMEGKMINKIKYLKYIYIVLYESVNLA